MITELSGLPLFQGVASWTIDKIRPEMVATFLDGDFLVHQGDQPTFLYVVLDGRVEITAGPKPEARVYIDSRTVGDIIGEQAFIERKEHSADVRARGEARVVRIPETIVDGFVGR